MIEKQGRREEKDRKGKYLSTWGGGGCFGVCLGVVGLGGLGGGKRSISELEGKKQKSARSAFQ